MATLEARVLSVSIERPWQAVYDFASVPENFPKWASGLGASLERVGDEWIAATAEGRVAVRFTQRNEFGVLDHEVVLAPGRIVSVPLRVVANADGSEVMLTLFRQPGMSDEKFAADAEWVLERNPIILDRILRP